MVLRTILWRVLDLGHPLQEFSHSFQILFTPSFIEVTAEDFHSKHRTPFYVKPIDKTQVSRASVRVLLYRSLSASLVFPYFTSLHHFASMKVGEVE